MIIVLCDNNIDRGSVETMEYYNEIGQSVDVVCYTSE
jgi:hypothetical protein